MENESESKEGVVEVDYDVDEYLIDLLWPVVYSISM
jgi:hypothetical protein